MAKSKKIIELTPSIKSNHGGYNITARSDHRAPANPDVVGASDPVLAPPAGGRRREDRTDDAGSASAQLDALVDAQAEIMDVIVQGASLEQALTNIALVSNRILRPAKCVIHLADSERAWLRLNPGPGLGVGAAQSAAPIEIGPETGPIAEAAHRGAAVTAGDLRGTPICPQLQGFIEENGLAACEVQPICNRRGTVLGTLTLFFDTLPEACPDRARAVAFLVSLAAFAVEIEQRNSVQRAANERFTSLATTIPGVVYQRRVTPDGDIRYTYISEGAKDLFGVSAEEILADPQALFACHGPEYRSDFRERLLEASRKLTLWDVEAQIITRDGEEKWTHAIARPRRQPDGSVLWDGVILDATRIKKTEMELRKARESAEAMSRSYQDAVTMLRSANDRFASLAATIPGVVYQRRVSPDGDIRYTYISEGAEELFGVSPEEILADPDALFACHGPEYRTNFRERLLKASRELTLWDVQAQIITRDGEEKWTHAIARPRRQPDGSVLWDGVILDATWIKKAEIELKKAKDLAESSSRAKSMFLAQVGHELRTPLNAVLGFSDVLKSEVFGPLGSKKYREYAEHINQSGTQLLNVINNILDFTKCGTGTLELSESRVRVRDALERVVRQAAPIAESAQVTLNVAADDGLPDIVADSCKLHEILSHLLSNAVKFTPQHGSVHLSASRSGTGDVVIRVKDTGIGIAEEDMPKLLEPFGQADCDLNRQYDGIGLGIPLAANLAKLHGARLTAESEIGLGTTVTLIFPRNRTFDDPDMPPPSRRLSLVKG
ncbi:MAG: PAS domain-containing protein [Rhodospirillales bacterium]|nr:MAG: PAS domain-containing protein [Rhodospirillales bacterium]